MMIRWTSLKRIAEELAKRPVNLHGSTSLPMNMKAAVSFDLTAATNAPVNLALNLRLNKHINDIIRSIAHELAHVLLGTDDHSPEHSELWLTLEKEITKRYEQA